MNNSLPGVLSFMGLHVLWNRAHSFIPHKKKKTRTFALNHTNLQNQDPSFWVLVQFIWSFSMTTSLGWKPHIPIYFIQINQGQACSRHSIIKHQYLASKIFKLLDLAFKTSYSSSIYFANLLELGLSA